MFITLLIKAWTLHKNRMIFYEIPGPFKNHNFSVKTLKFQT